MRQIDRYIAQLERLGAQTLQLASNAQAIARLADGSERVSNQVVDHAQLVAMVQESATQAALTEIRVSRPAQFRLVDCAPPVMVEVVPTPGAWKVTLTVLPAGSLDVLRRSSQAPVSAGSSQQALRVQVPLPVPPNVTLPVPPNVALGAAQPDPRGPLPPAEALASMAPDPRISATPAAPNGAPREAPLVQEAASRSSPVAVSAEAPADTSGIDHLLRLAASKGASDLHLSAERRPLMRLDGEMLRLEPEGTILPEATLRPMLLATMPAHVQEAFQTANDVDYAYEIAGVGRFRAAAYMDRHGTCGAFRRVPTEIVQPEDLGLSRQVLDLCNLTKGLVLVTGPTGCGKSTTLAAMVDRINTTRKDHIITIEDPIEFVHRNRRCLVNQREVRVHTGSFKDALRAALREDPDIVLVGEMRDLETIAIALETAETGHLVFGTLHTRTAPATVDRVIDQFPAERQAQIRTMLSESLKAVIAQVLCKKVGGGRVAAFEILIANPAISNLIREGKTFQLAGVMQTGRNIGMVTLNDALCDLVKAGKITPTEAYLRAISKAEIRSVMQQQGIPLPALPMV